MTVYSSVSQLVGNTPLYECKNFSTKNSALCTLLAKLEYKNPAGSIKDRAALFMIEDAEKSGRLLPGGAIIEPTSGNTGIAIASLAAAKGYRAVIVMPDNMSKERQSLMKAYGAKLVLTPGSDGMSGAIAKAREIAETEKGSIIAGQFDNPSNPDAHYRTTGPELWRDSDGKIDIFVSCVGSGGTFSGVSRYLKEQNPDIITVAVEPESSPLISKGQAGSHKIQGIGANFIPENLDKSLIDKIITVSDEEAYRAGRDFASCEGLLVGISSGAALAAALKLAQKEENRGKVIALVLPDGGERYLSTDGYLG